MAFPRVCQQVEQTIVQGDTLVLKLVRTPLNVYFTAFISIFLSLYAPITSDECHA